MLLVIWAALCSFLWYSFLLRSARSPWNLFTAGGAGRRAAVLTGACQMQQPKALVFRQLIFGINANPHYKSSAAPPFATRCGRVEAFLRSVVRILPVIEQQWIFLPLIVPAFFLLCLKYAWARGVCLRTAVGFFFVARPAAQSSSVVALPPSARVGLDS